MEIRSISKNLFGVKQNKSENNCNQTNPFGVNFKGNMIKMDVIKNADVFETAANSNRVKEVAKRGKMFTSAVVGSIGNVTASISTRFNKIKSSISNAWERANNIDVGKELRNCGSSLKSRVISMNEYSVHNLGKRQPESDLESMLREVVSIREAS